MDFDGWGVKMCRNKSFIFWQPSFTLEVVNIEIWILTGTVRKLLLSSILETGSTINSPFLLIPYQLNMLNQHWGHPRPTHLPRAHLHQWRVPRLRSPFRQPPTSQSLGQCLHVNISNRLSVGSQCPSLQHALPVPLLLLLVLLLCLQARI